MSSASSFNTCPHAGATIITNNVNLRSVVSIHAPTRGATNVCLRVTHYTKFQYMPPRGGQRTVSKASSLWIAVSIHAPTRGATVEGRLIEQRGIVSIHAPTRGATNAGMLYPVFCDVSIHAPTRGATGKEITRINEETEFQYMPPRGGQLTWLWDSVKWYFMFQYMPPRGGQPIATYYAIPTSTFQYMPPRGGQRVELYLLRVGDVEFQYMPPRGGQHLDEPGRKIHAVVSIHAPTRGAT